MSEIRWDRVTAAMLRMLPNKLVEDFFQSPEWNALTPAEKDQLYVADAYLEELDRKERQKARQERAEENYRRRQAAEGGGRP